VAGDLCLVEEPETRGCRVDREVGALEKDAGMKTRHHKNSKKSWRRSRWGQRRERNRVKRRAIGWIARKAWH